jgi:hypothetical protein
MHHNLHSPIMQLRWLFSGCRQHMRHSIGSCTCGIVQSLGAQSVSTCPAYQQQGFMQANATQCDIMRHEPVLNKWEKVTGWGPHTHSTRCKGCTTV